MKNFVDLLSEMDNFSLTENGAVALYSTQNAMLDAFGSLGSFVKNCDYSQGLEIFNRAWAEDRKMAMKLLFYMRDIRGGQGTRCLFRLIAHYIAQSYPEYMINNLDNFMFYGRADDLLCLIDTPAAPAMFTYLKNQLNSDLEAAKNNKDCSLMAKWLPSENASSQESALLAKRIREQFGWSARTYRKTLSYLRKYIKVVESKMSAKEWNKIDYEAVPAKAAMIYANAFMRHDEEGYDKYLDDLAEGKAKVNAKSLFPVDIVHKVMDNKYNSKPVTIKLTDAQWGALPNYFEEAGIDETGICVVDTSGSMCGTPLEVAISLGMYCADKCKGPFKDHFITFSANPRLQEIKGKNIFEKVSCLESADWMMNTDIEKVFDMILDTAVKNHCTQDEIPNKLYIISDMQWDACVIKNSKTTNRWDACGSKVNPETFMTTMEKKYAKAGYTMPNIVYWNVRSSKCGMFQKTAKDSGCCMVSGYSPSLFKSVLLGTEYVEEVNEKGEKVVKQKIDPVSMMNNTLNNERYDRVWVGV